jgi:hypothetical protein
MENFWILVGAWAFGLVVVGIGERLWPTAGGAGHG